MTVRKNTRRSSPRQKQGRRWPQLSEWMYVFVAASLMAAGAMICVLVELYRSS